MSTEPTPEPFNLQQHLSAIHEGRANLVARRERLKEEIANLQAGLASVDVDIAQIDKMFGPLEPAAAEAKAPRMSGVLKLVSELVADISSWISDGTCEFTLSVFVTEAKRRQPEIKTASIRSALARLVERGELIRSEAPGEPAFILPKLVPSSGESNDAEEVVGKPLFPGANP